MKEVLQSESRRSSIVPHPALSNSSATCATSNLITDAFRLVNISVFQQHLQRPSIQIERDPTLRSLRLSIVIFIRFVNLSSFQQHLQRPSVKPERGPTISISSATSTTSRWYLIEYRQHFINGFLCPTKKGKHPGV